MDSFTYAHMADLHLGSWRDQKMRDLSTKVFLTAIDQCLEKKVNFMLFSGDIFNTSLPSLDTLKIVTKKLKELQDKNIPLYVIAGSHDFSPSGKTMIDVLENAGLLKNVCKGTVDEQNKLHLSFTVDAATGAKITGILGRKGLLDKAYYENLFLENLEQEKGYKIFMFHTAISELKPKHLETMEAQPVSFLPKNFQYYAGGHIHHPTQREIPGYGTITYPGALFPNNFAEIEKYSRGGYYLITVDHGEQQVIWQPVEVIQHRSLIFPCQHKSPEVVTFDIINSFHNQDLHDTLMTIRVTGSLSGGRITQINFKEIFEQLLAQGAYFIMKNTSQLHSEEFEEIQIAQSNPELIEEHTIREHLQQLKLFDSEQEFQLTNELLSCLNTAKREGETVTDFQKRVDSEVDRMLHLDE